MFRAIIYIRHWVDWPRCQAHCTRHGYHVRGVTYDPDGSKYLSAYEGITFGKQAEVLVAARWSDIPVDRVPRIEIADEPEPLLLPEDPEQTVPLPAIDLAAKRAQRRTRLIRRGGGA